MYIEFPCFYILNFFNLNTYDKVYLCFRLLCLDGGGIRGLILVQILTELQELSKRPIIDCFDWVAGTSIGGILSLGLSLGKTLHECKCMFFKFKNTAFEGERPYSPNNLELFLKETFGMFIFFTPEHITGFIILYFHFIFKVKIHFYLRLNTQNL